MSFRIQKPREHFLDGANNLALARQRQGNQKSEASLTHHPVSFRVYIKTQTK